MYCKLLPKSWRQWLSFCGGLLAVGLAFGPHGYGQQPVSAEAFFDNKAASAPSRGAKNDIKPTDVIHWQVFDATAYQDGSVLVTLRLSTEQGFTLYREKVTFASPSGYELVKVRTPPTEPLVDPITEEQVEVYRGGEFFLLFSGLEPYTGRHFPLSIRYLGCTSRICLFPYTETMQVDSFLSKEVSHSLVFADETGAATADGSEPASSDGEPVERGLGEADAPEEAVTGGQGASSADADAPGAGLGFEDRLARQLQEGALPLSLLFLIVFLGGLLTNLTPCVYPMIPITVRLLANQGRTPLAGASAYAAGIMLTYTALGVFAAATGSMFGQMMASPIFNSVFALVMLLLGLSMLGFGDLAFLQNLGMKVGSGRASIKNAFLMGTGAGLVASPCTGPILAALLAYTATTQSGMATASLLLFVYSLGFALPYILLGSAAARVGRLQVGPRVQVGIKMLFAALMFGLAFYYLRIPFYHVLKSWHGHWPALTLTTLALGLAGAVAVLAVTAWQHRKVLLLLPALLIGTGVFAGSQWLVRSAGSEAREKLVWQTDEAAALAEAKARGVPLLIDMWAEWCEACKKMDATTFSEASIIERLQAEKWVLLKFDLTESSEKNDKIQEKYKVHGLPTLVLIAPDRDEPQMLAGYVSAEALHEQMRRLLDRRGE